MSRTGLVGIVLALLLGAVGPVGAQQALSRAIPLFGSADVLQLSPALTRQRSELWPPSRARRSWTRTVLGGALVASAFLVPLGRESCVLLPVFSGGAERACTLHLYPARVVAAVSLTGAGVALSTVFSSVRPSRTRVAMTPGRFVVTHVVGF